jgi:hypothetical protein
MFFLMGDRNGVALVAVVDPMGVRPLGCNM